ncbi:indole-3-acetic acid-amido synthetase GH3.6-like isoform X2 [Apium graveolens]|uniref:indole-3-acetic acid-amido synthetase GH3.6-like isoform X2 n=1 Tax=Apium graveolens TaxID=4045 RepID=UPI003D79B48B
MESSSVTMKDNEVLECIENVTRNASKIQKQVLCEILTRNAGVEYLQRTGLDGRTDIDSFKKFVPIITYEDIRTDINRIANGDKSPILCSQPISEFLTSSGTSGGERKLIPTTEEEIERKSFFCSLSMPVMNQGFPGLDNGKAMYFIFLKSESRTPGGLLARTAVANFYQSTLSRNRGSENELHSKYTSPNAAILCLDNYQSMYSQFLCGLCLRKEVVRVGASFSFTFIRAIQFLETNWSLLSNDIRTGTLNPAITDQLLRESVLTKILKPDPVLADIIDAECSKKSWKGIIRSLWPNTKCLEVVVTGTMSQYIPTLEYYSNGLPIVSSTYCSSECFSGSNMAGDASSNVEATINEKAQNKLVDLVDVKLGKEYELVVTTYAGLYRYRVGDVLRVAAFKNEAPQFNFICRNNVALSIEADKTEESELQSAVEKAVMNHLSPLDVNLVDYTAYADTSTTPGHYVIFWEYNVFNGGSITTSQVVPSWVFEDCCLDIEESLNSVYRQGRVATKSIGPLEIKIVEKGSFNEVMDYAISLGASLSQYKTPRSLKLGPIVDLLNSKVVSNYYSPKCPAWDPSKFVM